MRMRTLTVALIAVLSVASLASAAEKFVLDAAHSAVGFSVRHLVISKTKGDFNSVSATLLYDANDITKSSVEVSIETASIDTDNEQRDEHLRSADFFDAEKYPSIVFKSKKIEKRKDGHVAVGDLTIRDVTKEIELPFEMTGVVKDPWGNTKIGVEGELVIDRRDFGLTWSKVLETGALVVGNDVEIEISVEFGKEQ